MMKKGTEHIEVALCNEFPRSFEQTTVMVMWFLCKENHGIELKRFHKDLWENKCYDHVIFMQDTFARAHKCNANGPSARDD